MPRQILQGRYKERPQISGGDMIVDVETSMGLPPGEKHQIHPTHSTRNNVQQGLGADGLASDCRVWRVIRCFQGAGGTILLIASRHAHARSTGSSLPCISRLIRCRRLRSAMRCSNSHLHAGKIHWPWPPAPVLGSGLSRGRMVRIMKALRPFCGRSHSGHRALMAWARLTEASQLRL